MTQINLTALQGLLQVRRDNIDDVTAFVPREYLGGVVFLDSIGDPLPDHLVSETIGIWLITPHGKLLARQSDWIANLAGTLHVFNDQVRNNVFHGDIT